MARLRQMQDPGYGKRNKPEMKFVFFVNYSESACFLQGTMLEYY